MFAFWKSRKRIEDPAPGTGSDRAYPVEEKTFDCDPGYLSLEPRRVLSADFSLLGGVLDLDNFSQTADENLRIEDSGSQFVFTLSEGTWTGIDTTQITGDGTNVLLVDKSAVTDLEVTDNASIDLDINFGNAGLRSLTSVDITTTGDIGQDANSSLRVDRIDLDAGAIDLGNRNNNFGQVSAEADTDVTLGDRNGINLQSIAANGKIDVHASGIAVNDRLSAETVWLDSSRGAIQNGAGQIDATNLIVTGDGTFRISALTNEIDSLAGNVDGTLIYSDADDFNIARLECDGQMWCGVTTTSDLILFSDGTISQDADAAFFVGGDGFFSTPNGDICLEGGDCDGDGLNDNRIVGSTNVVSNGEVVIGEDEDVSINSVAGNGRFRFIGNNIQINTDISGTQLLIQANDGVSLNGNSINVDNLLLKGIGTFDFSGSGNTIDNIAGEISGSLLLDANSSLHVGSLVFASKCGDVSACGLNVSDTVSINLNNADLTQSSAIVVGGRMTVATGTGVIQLDSGDCDGDGANDNDFLEIEIVSAGEIEIADVNNINVVFAQSSGNVAIKAGDSSTTGRIVLEGDVTSNDRVLLQATNGVDQTAGALTTDALILDGTGDFHLCEINHVGNPATPGQLSANVDGDLYFSNSFQVEMAGLQIQTLSGSTVAHSHVEVSGDLSVISNVSNATAISDLTDIRVSGDLQLIATGTDATIAADNLFATGSVGVATADGDAIIINHHANGLDFRGDDIPGVPAIEVCAHFEQSVVNGNLYAQATAGDITNSSGATLIVSNELTLVAGTDNGASVSGSNNEFDVLLGLQGNDNIRVGTLGINAADASIQLDSSVEFTNTYVGVPDANDVTGGTLFVNVDGFINQQSSSMVSADNAAMIASEYIRLSSLDAGQAAFHAFGFGDTEALSELPESLPDDPSDEFAPRHTDIDNEYGVIITSTGDLTLTTVEDELNGQQKITGVFADQGHAFVETINGGDIHFDGAGSALTFNANNQTFDVAVEMQNGHVLTSIASGDLTIKADTALLSQSGSVTDVGTFTTDEGREFENVTLEGPQFELFLPTPSDDPTTRTVNNDDTQFIGIDFGRSGGSSFVVEVLWADGAFDVLQFETGIGNRFERISHQFDANFLFMNFELPTELAFFNDPAINLFDLNGNANLNEANDLNTNTNFVLAYSDSRPQGNLEIASVDRPDLPARESVQFAGSEVSSKETEVTEFGPVTTTQQEELSEAYLIRLDDAGGEIEASLQELDETTVTQDVIAQWKKRVNDGTQYPPGSYRIKWIESGVTFSIEFEKGAEEDLLPDELNDQDSRANGDESTDINFDDENANEDGADTIQDLREIIPPMPDDESGDGQVGQPAEKPFTAGSDETDKATNPLTGTTANAESELTFQVEEVARPANTGIIAAGALAFALRRREAGRNRSSTGDDSLESSRQQIEQLGSESSKISFVKAARTRRRIGGSNDR